MRLERLEINGFKSFYEKVDLSFPGSVTGSAQVAKRPIP